MDGSDGLSGLSRLIAFARERSGFRRSQFTVHRPFLRGRSILKVVQVANILLYHCDGKQRGLLNRSRGAERPKCASALPLCSTSSVCLSFVDVSFLLHLFQCVHFLLVDLTVKVSSAVPSNPVNEQRSLILLPFPAPLATSDRLIIILSSSIAPN
jgi:hypothetical protein